jgi:hypothetical protein
VRHCIPPTHPFLVFPDNLHIDVSYFPAWRVDCTNESREDNAGRVSSATVLCVKFIGTLRDTYAVALYAIYGSSRALKGKLSVATMRRENLSDC